MRASLASSSATGGGGGKATVSAGFLAAEAAPGCLGNKCCVGAGWLADADGGILGEGEGSSSPAPVISRVRDQINIHATSFQKFGKSILTKSKITYQYALCAPAWHASMPAHRPSALLLPLPVASAAALPPAIHTRQEKKNKIRNRISAFGKPN